ncbi:MAG TPA: protein kinase [Polyangiaceae bacterium]|jgi:tRNA A-37 threonylcarbamoyl transferase component Bud32|nr:MAG: Serine/threonine-protein kinase Pkn1 [Deltaproteobacteria bacterium ADurb.Bin207]HNS98563.1 protein kinase [Polyangiaceae bacterium]HNZ25073.1 protein kinase [Polyangiaceae bacterium]HOD25575.1 protein kinase [Polyangiaceae bacterium]HOE49931.1 protein kinase [Polyangiaceae bacterium]
MYARGIEPGDIIADRYLVERFIARGGMAYVVAATHIGFGDRVAVKVLFPEAASQPELVQRFLLEGRVARKITSPHVVAVTDMGTLHSGTPFMIMEYLDGTDLAKILQCGPLPVELATQYILQVCEALAEAHTLGIVHRDLKPANIFLTKGADGEPLIKVLDFGIAKTVGGLSSMTDTHSVMGSGPYMPPEQLESARAVDPRSDIWSLGVVLFELVSGKQPFYAPSLPKVFSRILNGAPDHLDTVFPQAPEGLAEVIGRCLRRNREERYADVAEFAAALCPFTNGRGRRSIATVQSVWQRASESSPAPHTLDFGTADDQTVVLPRHSPVAAANPLAADSTMPSWRAEAPEKSEPFSLVVAHSDDPDTEAAVTEVLTQCLWSLRDRTPKAALVFAGIDHDHQILLDRIHDQWPGLAVIGCTTDGELSSLGQFKEDSIAVALFVSDKLSFGVGLGTGVALDPEAAAQQAVRQARDQLGVEPVLCITTPASLIVSGVRVLDAVKKQLGQQFPVFGGTAGDQLRLEYTYQFAGTSVVKDGLPVLLIGGPLRFGAGLSSGWRPIGTSGVVTKANANVLITIGEQRAADFFVERIGKFSTPAELRAMVVSHPFAVARNDGYYLRSTFTVDLDQGVVHCLGDVPEGATVQIANGSRDDVLAGSLTSIEQAIQAFDGEKIGGILVFSCAARRMLLGDRVKEEVERIQTIAPPGLPIIGFYTYGELGPLHPGGEPEFHNMTCFSLVLGE